MQTFLKNLLPLLLLVLISISCLPAPPLMSRKTGYPSSEMRELSQLYLRKPLLGRIKYWKFRREARRNSQSIKKRKGEGEK